MGINLLKTTVKEQLQIVKCVEDGEEIYRYIDGERHIGVQEMMQEYVNGDVEIINTLVYNGMVNVSVGIHLVDFSNITTKEIQRMRVEEKVMYGEDNHFQEELIGGGLIMVVVETAFMLDQRQIQMLLVIVNLEDQIHNLRMEHMEVSRGQSVRMKDKRVIIVVWLDMAIKIGGFIVQEEMVQD